MRTILALGAFFGFFGVTNTPPSGGSELLPFLGTVIAGILTSGVAYLAYVRSKKTDKKQAEIQETLGVIKGFNDLTKRLQETVESQDHKLDELDKWHKNLVGKIENELDECEKDRQNLKIDMVKVQAEVQFNREMITRFETKPETKP